MWKVKKIFETILIFVIIVFLISLGVSFLGVIVGNINIGDIFNKTWTYFLYTIGYGSLENEIFLENFLAMIGIVGLALMSTFLTINLFWRMDDVKLNKKVICSKDTLIWSFRNMGKSICDLKASFVIYDAELNQNIGDALEFNMPVLMSKTTWNLEVSLEETFWYKAIYNILSSNNKKLYCIYSFVDTKNGQSSIKVLEIKKENLYMDEEIISLDKFLEPIVISNKLLEKVENGGSLSLENKNNKSILNYKFKNKNSGFVMAYYNFHQNNLNLAKYNPDSYLEFNIKSRNKVIVHLEIKNIYGTIKDVQIISDGLAKNKVYLKDMNNTNNISEVCFTIFSNENNLVGEINISDLKIIQI